MRIVRARRGAGPLSISGATESRVLLQVGRGTPAATNLVLAAVVASQRELQGTWRELAVTDPLAGLANHRQLVQSPEPEIKPSPRPAQPLAGVLPGLHGPTPLNAPHRPASGRQASSPA